MDIVLLTSVLPFNDDKIQYNQENLFRGMGAYQIAWYLREFGYSVQVIDFIKFLPVREIYELLDKFVDSSTKIIGFGILGTIEQDPWAFMKFQELLGEIRKRYPWVTIVGGGPTANRFEDEFAKNTFDWLVVGHAEDTMLALCNHLFRGSPRPTYERTEKNTKLLKASFPLQLTVNFDIQHSGHRWHKRDCVQQGEALPLETSRGCIFKCKFCQFPHIGKHKRDFLRSMQEIKDELLDNYEKYKTVNYYILDDTFNADKERLEEFWQMTKTLPFKIRYATYLRLDLIEAHPETAMMLLESGLIGAFFGIESFNPAAALMVGKAFSGKKAKTYLPILMNDIWKNQVSIFCGVIAGFPQETYEDLEETNKWLHENNIHMWNWNALYINRAFSSMTEYSSVFDREAEKYGFIFEGNTNNWKTSTTSWTESRKWAYKLQQLPNTVGKVGAWAIPEYLNYPSMSVDILLNEPVAKLSKYNIVEDRRVWLSNYVEQLKNL